MMHTLAQLLTTFWAGLYPSLPLEHSLSIILKLSLSASLMFCSAMQIAQHAQPVSIVSSEAQVQQEPPAAEVIASPEVYAYCEAYVQDAPVTAEPQMQAQPEDADGTTLVQTPVHKAPAQDTLAQEALSFTSVPAFFAEEAPSSGEVGLWQEGWYIVHNWSRYGQTVLELVEGDLFYADGAAHVVAGVFDIANYLGDADVWSITGKGATILQTCIPGTDLNRIVWAYP